MTASLTDIRPAPTRAIALMIGTMLCFTIMDACAKMLSQQVGVLPTLWARYTGQMVLVLVLILPRFGDTVRTRYPWLQLLRSVVLAGATGFFFLALSRIPLNEAAALMSVNPVLITLGAALFLGEQLGLRRIIGITLALLGAVIILRPGSDVFEPEALYALGAAVCYSTYALLTRKVGPDENVWTSLFYTGLFGSLILSAAVPFAWAPPDGSAIALMLAISVIGMLGQLCLIGAFSQGEAAMLAPYSYTGLIFATLWGMLIFAEIPDRWTIGGALVIAAAGLYVWHRETFRSRPRP
ncbi:MAG: DMT family transporter [Marinibacterium sp.]|nr:DMT family transporter [Marinibacterium sp.]